uniref:Uncharacterized protein n=1 Tax=Oryza meridionalis TaxID=40149 RepID=A0A0E0DIB4_9ORYZ
MDAEGSDAEAARGGSKMLLRSLDYSCVTRLRHRLLLAFLINNDYMDAYDEINKRRRLVFHVSDLQDLMKKGRLVEASNYVWRFAPPGGEPSSSAEAVTLWKFIHQLMVLDSFAHGTRDDTAFHGWFTRILAEPPGFSVLYPSCLALAAHFVAGRVEAARDMVDWKVVRSKAASLAGKMAREVPEIRCTMLLPLARGAKPKDLFPLIASSSFRRRRYVKAARRASSSHQLAQFYLDKKKRPGCLLQVIQRYVCILVGVRGLVLKIFPSKV